jgi:hypothetical protein
MVEVIREIVESSISTMPPYHRPDRPTLFRGGSPLSHAGRLGAQAYASYCGLLLTQCLTLVV